MIILNNRIITKHNMISSNSNSASPYASVPKKSRGESVNYGTAKRPLPEVDPDTSTTEQSALNSNSNAITSLRTMARNDALGKKQNYLKDLISQRRE